MSGICGKIYFDKDRHVTTRELQLMASCLEHRGPDAQGFWVGDNIGIANRRLAVIDMSDTASHPMRNEDGSLWITCDGEIYNFKELRKDLMSKGHTFLSNGTTEVILHAYEEYGRRCLDRLRGMFSFAIWNVRTQTLFLARDRVGRKPLFYFIDGDHFLFGSEIKPILTDLSVPIEPNLVAIDHFLRLGYIPSPLSTFREIQKLPAAHWLEINEGRIEVGRYWKLHFSPKRTITLPDAKEELQNHITEATQLSLLSDVPVGIHIKGDINSSILLANMASILDYPVSTFDIKFEDGLFNKSLTREIAILFGTSHHEVAIHNNVVDILPHIVKCYNEPFSDASAVLNYLASQYMRQDVKITVDSDGINEALAGYNLNILGYLARLGSVIPPVIRQKLAAIVRHFPPRWQNLDVVQNLVNPTETFLQISKHWKYGSFGYFTPNSNRDLYTKEFQYEVIDIDEKQLFIDIVEGSDAENWIDATLDIYVQLYLADDVLVKTDRTTMCHSIDSRSPFLDHVLMEFIAQLPTSFKFSGSQERALQREACRALIPHAILRQTKDGIHPPYPTRFLGCMREMAHDVLLSSHALQRGYFKPEAINSLLTKHYKGQEDHGQRLWTLLTLELWHRAFIDDSA